MKKHEFVLNSTSGRKFSCDVSFKADGEAKPIILFVHGFKGFKDWGYFNLMSDYFANEGFVFVKMNFSHNGTTPEHPIDFVDLEAFGQNNFSKELDDLGVALNCILSNDFIVQEKELKADEIYLMGHSRGGASVLLKAGEDERVKKVATLAAVHDLTKRWPEELLEDWKEKGVEYIFNSRTEQNMPLYYQLVEDFFTHRDRFDIPEVVKQKLNIPIFLSHGGMDETLPVATAKELASWNDNAELFLIDDANHVFGGKHPYEESELPHHAKMVFQKMVDFFR